MENNNKITWKLLWLVAVAFKEMLFCPDPILGLNFVWHAFYKWLEEAVSV